MKPATGKVVGPGYACTYNAPGIDGRKLIVCINSAGAVHAYAEVVVHGPDKKVMVYCKVTTSPTDRPFGYLTMNCTVGRSHAIMELRPSLYSVKLHSDG